MCWLAIPSSLHSLLIIDVLNIQTTLSMCWLSRSARERVMDSPRTPSTVSPIDPLREAPRSVVRGEILQFQPLVLTPWPSACLKGLKSLRPSCPGSLLPFSDEASLLLSHGHLSCTNRHLALPSAYPGLSCLSAVLRTSEESPPYPSKQQSRFLHPYILSFSLQTLRVSECPGSA